MAARSLRSSLIDGQKLYLQYGSMKLEEFTYRRTEALPPVWQQEA